MKLCNISLLIRIKFENEKTSVIQHVRFCNVFFAYIISKLNKLKVRKMLGIKYLEKSCYSYIMPNFGPSRKSLQKNKQIKARYS